jgi:hypothetical protein
MRTIIFALVLSLIFTPSYLHSQVQPSAGAQSEIDTLRSQSQGLLEDAISKHQQLRQFSNRMMLHPCTKNVARIVEDHLYTKAELDGIRSNLKRADTTTLLLGVLTLYGLNDSLLRVIEISLDSCKRGRPINLNAA